MRMWCNEFRTVAATRRGTKELIENSAALTRQQPWPNMLRPAHKHVIGQTISQARVRALLHGAPSQLRAALVLATLAAVLPVSAAAQAWVPKRGEGELSVVYENLYTRDHLDKDGNPFDVGSVRVQALVHSLDIGLTDKLALTATMPLVTGKYDGSFPHQLPIDDGRYHGGVGDFRLAARYQIREKPLTITPFIGVSFPTVPYQHFAHSAIGADMWEVALGVNAGRRLNPWLRDAYVQARYAYIVTQNVSVPSFHYSVRPNRSRADAEIGYFLTRRLTVRALANSQLTHDGLDTDAFPPPTQTLTNDLWRHHDQISAISYLNAGAGASFAISDALETFVAYEKTAWGENGHALNGGLAVGVSWSFQTPWARGKTAYTQHAANWHTKPTEMKLCH